MQKRMELLQLLKKETQIKDKQNLSLKLGTQTTQLIKSRELRNQNANLQDKEGC